MKKLLNLFIQAILISSFSFSVSSCFNPLTRNSSDNGKREPPIVIKNIKYYQDLIKETKIHAANCKEWIAQVKEDWKNDKDGNTSDEDYQQLLDQISVGLYTYQSEINEYQYQILLLEKKGEKFTFAQILQGIEILTEKITNLEKTLMLQEKYPNDYPESELKKNKNTLKEAQEIRKILLKLKEENENKWSN
ncbi:MAG: hypothetical protein ACRC8P_02345 [Spiroplasma sp.]